MLQKFKPLFLVYLFVLSVPLCAQRFNGNSYYSGFGLGDVMSPGTVRNLGMGGTGASHSHVEFINNLNPALLHADRYINNDSATYRYTLFDASMLISGRKSSTTVASQNNYGANFNYFTWTVPLSKKWTSNLGLQPFTQVNYRTTYRNAVVGGGTTDSATITRSGVGGLYQVYWGNGIDVNKNWSVGFQCSYIFGNRTDATSTKITNAVSSAIDLMVLNNKIYQQAVSIKPGIAYRRQFNKTPDRDSAIYINGGLTYELFGGGSGKQNINVQNQDTLGTVFSTQQVSSNNISVTFPSIIRGGLSFDKPKQWMLAADFTYTPWSNYRGFDVRNKLVNSYTVALGGECYTGNKQDDSRRKILRAGMAYSKTPFQTPTGIQLNDFSASIGASIPFGKTKERLYRPLNKLNLALVVGQRGTTQEKLVKELYFKLYFGFIISEEWFHKSKID
jgi:hypothetical protein